MSEKTRYFKIGLFTLGSLVLLCIGLILFGAGSLFQAPPIVVETYFEGSVQGLDVGALVKMNGVRIGKVKDIFFVKDVYGLDKSADQMSALYTTVCTILELESKYFPRLRDMNGREARQAMLDKMIAQSNLRAVLKSIGITGLVYVELSFPDPKETPPAMQIDWQPKELYIPSAAGVATRLGDSLEKMLNKMDSDIYPMIENLNKASNDFPALTAKLNEVMPHIASISKNIDDITSTGKKYPSQMIFGDAPPKSRYGQ